MRNSNVNPILRTLINSMSPEVPESDETFPPEPDFYERNYGEYAEEKRLDDAQRARDLK